MAGPCPKAALKWGATQPEIQRDCWLTIAQFYENFAAQTTSNFSNAKWTHVWRQSLPKNAQTCCNLSWRIGFVVQQWLLRIHEGHYDFLERHNAWSSNRDMIYTRLLVFMTSRATSGHQACKNHIIIRFLSSPFWSSWSSSQPRREIPVFAYVPQHCWKTASAFGRLN